MTTHEHPATETARATATASQPVTIGILGGGQLGKMLAEEAHRRGHRVIVRTDEPNGPASLVADDTVVGRYRDAALNEQFADMVDVITAEFENLPVPMLRFFEDRLTVHPSSSAIGICQHRESEKLFLRSHKFPHTPFVVATSAAEADEAFRALDEKAVMKTAAFGYDGKGQVVLNVGDDAAAAFRKVGGERVVIEQWVDFACEISIIGARATDGTWVSFPAVENHHLKGVLDYSVSPATISENIAAAADRMTRRVAEALQFVGLMTVELFVLHDGSLLVNEIAPRPHNSGHHTIESCEVSQYGLQIEAVLGLSFSRYAQSGKVTQGSSSAVMVNLLGDLWANGEPNWDGFDQPNVMLHLYGKSPRPGRKMGHFTVLNSATEEALALRSAL